MTTTATSERIEAAIAARDLGTAAVMLNAMYAEHRAAGLAVTFPNLASPEGTRRRLMHLFNALRDEIEAANTDKENPLLTDPVTGAIWRYRYSSTIESYECVEA